MGENVQIPLDDTKVGFYLESFESTHDVYYSAKDVTQGLKYNWKLSYTLNYVVFCKCIHIHTSIVISIKILSYSI